MMDDGLDMNLLHYFDDQAAQLEAELMGNPAPDQGVMAQPTSVFSTEDELMQALELEIFEKILTEKESD